jgi:hypothetical protein
LSARVGQPLADRLGRAGSSWNRRPAAMENPDSLWYDVLRFVVDAEYDF